MGALVDTLVLLGALQGAGLAIVLGLRRKDALANRLLGALMAAVAAMLASDYVASRLAFSGQPHWLAIGAPLPYTFGPLLYLYIVALTRPASKADPRWLVHALPAFAYLVYMTAHFYVLDGAEKLAVVREIRAGHGPPSARVLQWLQVLQAVSYLGASWLALSRYGRKMRAYFSDLTRIDLRWLRVMVLAHAATWSIVITSYGVRLFGFEADLLEALSRGVQIGSTLVIFLTGYMSLWQPELSQKAGAAAAFEPRDSASSEPPASREPEQPLPPTEPVPTTQPARLSLAQAAEPARVKYQRNRIEDAEARELVERLLRLMQEKRPYREAGLTLPELADAIGVTGHALSQILNVRVQKTFYAFVNSYRVEEVKEALADPGQNARGVLEIAYEAGFNSKSTLNSFFKRETGLTPTEYRTQAQKRPPQVEAA